ncbi:retrotransposon protein, putative, ty1-copia subclass [Tanacetum coccineum]
MAQPDNNNTLSSAFKTFFEREKLTGDNFNDWYRSLRIVLRVAGTYDYLFKPCPDEPPEDAAENVKAAWKAEYKIHSDVACLMLGRMSPALQRQFELYFPQAMLDELRRMFEKPKAVEIYDLVDTLHSCKQAPGKSVSAHVLEMKGYMDQLQALGKPYDNDMAINLINMSFNKDFGDFIRNFNMHCVGKTVSDLHALLIDYEKGLKDKAPTPQVLAIQKGRVNKPKPQANKKGKGKGKADKNKQVVAYQPKPKQNPSQKKENPKKDQACHYCNVVGHWKRNCPLYLEELRTNKNKKAEHGAAPSVKRKLSYGEQYLHVGNGAQAAVEAIGVIERSRGEFSPVADIRAIRILIAIAAYYDYEIWQMDVKTAFLNGRLDEDIYMEQPEGYVNPRYPNRVCKLQRSIYGLKQASRQWNKRFDEEIKKFGFTQNRDEPCVYRKASGSNVVFLILYVDDILIMGNNIPRLKEVKDYLGKCFSMKDLGEAAYILGIKIYRDRSKRLIGLSQSAYIDKILKKFNMHNSKKGYLPMEVKHELSNEMCASTPEEVAYMKKVPYASAVGSIMYAVRCTRPDVAFAQNLVSRYQQNPGKLHWVAVKHILKYLRNTRDMFLVYGGKPDTELNVTGFCDASWQCDKDDTKSQTGYVFVVNGGAVDWKSKKQTTIAMSATQAEYMAASEAAMEAVWIRKFVGDLGVMPSIKKPINMYCDNSAAIIFVNDSGVMKGARHFLRRYHYVREQVESGEIKILKVHTDDNLADPFTKALPRRKVTDLANGIGLQLASSFNL